MNILLIVSVIATIFVSALFYQIYSHWSEITDEWILPVTLGILLNIAAVLILWGLVFAS